MDSIRILLADDHTLFREGMRLLLSAIPDMQVVGECADGEAALALAAELQPDVILMDIKMPKLNGVEATRQILHASPHIGVVVLTMFEDDDSVFNAMRAGARGYVLKEASDDEMLRTLRAVALGEANFGPAIARRLTAFFGALPQDKPHLSRSQLVFPQLGDRERDVLNALAQGESNEAIARALNVSLKTVRNYVSNIFNKLQVADRAEAILRARQAGLG